jgi:hypothetical protein
MSRLVLTLVPLFVACSDSTDAIWGGDYDWNSNDLLSGRLAGDLDSVRDFDDDLAHGYSNVGPDYAHVEMHVLGDFGWAMLGVDVWGPTPMADGTYEADANTRGDEGASVIGCSGPGEYEAAFDAPADDAVIEISTDPETGDVVVEVTADFGREGTVSGTAVLPPDVRTR